jgi:hypothetical protein
VGPAKPEHFTRCSRRFAPKDHQRSLQLLLLVVEWLRRRRVVRLFVVWAADFFPSCSNHIADVDSPRAVVPVGTGSGVRMPGSFECDDDDEAELDALVVGIRKLGV